MKNLKLILLLVLAPLSFYGQTLSGLWMGNLSNDSTSVRKDQSFEIVLSQYKEKVVGYSRNTFIVNDTLYYIVKRVKGTITGDICEVKDEYVVSHNFPKKPEKGVKVVSTFHRNKQDSTWYLAGDWKTTKTKKYYAVSGKVDLKEEKDLTASKLFPHLEELGLDKDVPIFAATKKATEESVVKNKPQDNPVSVQKPAVKEPNKEIAKVNNENKPVSSPPVNNTATTSIPNPSNSDKLIVKNEPRSAVVVKEEKPAIETVSTSQVVNKPPVTNPETRKDASTINNTVATAPSGEKNNTPGSKPLTPGQETKNNNSNPIAATQKPVVEEEPRVLEDLGNTVITRNPPARTTPANTQANTEKTSAANTIANETKKPATEAKKEIATVQPTVTPKKLETQSSGLPKSLSSSPAAAYVAERITEAPQYVNYVSDSLVLILYDNGEVDGDTVSVLLNGSMFMEKQGLKTAAIKKTIYITPGNEELTLILYAENLGRYPPNTGLLVIYDGEDRHQLRFSADLKKNASVVFRRKK